MHEYDSVSVIRMASKQAGRSHVVFLMGTIWCKVSSFVPRPAALLCMNIQTCVCVCACVRVCAWCACINYVLSKQTESLLSPL